MQNKISYYVKIFMLDHETFGSNETRTVENRAMFTLDDARPSNSLFFIGKCGGEMRVELSALVKQLANGDVNVSGKALLFEGTSENTSDLDGQSGFNKNIAANTTNSISFRVRNTDEGGDYADILLEFTNTKLNDQDCPNNIRTKATVLGLGFTGIAVSDINSPTPVRNGMKVDFAKCDIYCSPATGTHEVHGDIRAKYDAKGGPDSDLFLPVTDETTTPDTIGRYNHFSGNGSIYWQPNTGPMEVRGGIRGSWARQGWERSHYGYPTSDEMMINANPAQWFSDFQNGVIFWQDNAEIQPKIAAINGGQVRKAFENIFKQKANDPNLKIDSVNIVGIGNTRYDFWRSKNRIITFQISGEYAVDWIPDPDYKITLHLEFFADPIPNGKVASKIFARSVGFSITTTNFAGLGTRELADGLKAKLTEIFRNPIDLTNNQSIPENAGLLSFKVMADGGFSFYFRPDFAGGFAAAVVQNMLNNMAE